ncbi:RNA-binding domain-containing protein [Marinococcus halophilus]|uniref:RNA-binding domain-containing protein n=1 Tax=Marinococcus halophilus TaxID=1371 RepID=UPI0009A8317F|nr:RNA-binding domain-containing protein [Marinococcus halophilus]
MPLPIEGLTLEYKTASKDLPKDFWKTYSSFANTTGGQVILGVKEEPKDNFEIVGVEDPNKIKKQLFDTLHSDKVSIDLINEDDVIIDKASDEKFIITINIPEAHFKSKPVHLNKQLGESYIRTHEGDYKCSTEQLRNLIRNAHENMDDQLLNKFTIEDDLDEDTIENYKRKLQKGDSTSHYDIKNNLEFLKEVGAIRKNRENGENQLTFGALLFFGKYNSIREVVPHFHLEYLNKSDPSYDRWIDRVASGDVGYPNLNLYNFFFIVLEKLKLTTNQDFSLDEDLSRTSNQETEVALREALANSIIHADYQQNLAVKITYYNDHYEFENPGKMRISVEEFAMGGSSFPRNSIIEQLFRIIGYVERSGSGGKKIFQAAKSKDYKTPDIEQSSNATLLRFWKVDTIQAFPSLSQEEQEILTLLKRNKVMNAKELEKSTGLNKSKIINTLNELRNKELVIREGKGRATTYLFKETNVEKVASLGYITRQLQKEFTN